MNAKQQNKAIKHNLVRNKLCKIDRCNSVYYTNPELCDQWDTEKNGDMKDFLPGMGCKVDWICDIDNHHKWLATIGNRTRKHTGCPICINKIACPEDGCNSIYYTHSQLRDQWDVKENPDMKTVVAG
jgi:hypothetical protein